MWLSLGEYNDREKKEVTNTANHVSSHNYTSALEKKKSMKGEITQLQWE